MNALVVKKIVVAGAVLVTGLVPSASAAAMSNSGTNIRSSNNLNTSVNANKTNANSSSNVSYLNKTVNYEAFSYVKYSATVTAFTANKQNSFNNSMLSASLNKSSNSEFSMPAFFNQFN